MPFCTSPQNINFAGGYGRKLSTTELSVTSRQSFCISQEVCRSQPLCVHASRLTGPCTYSVEVLSPNSPNAWYVVRRRLHVDDEQENTFVQKRHGTPCKSPILECHPCATELPAFPHARDYPASILKGNRLCRCFYSLGRTLSAVEPDERFLKIGKFISELWGIDSI